ncbi:MAG: hypothetical protein ACTHU0_15200 [Kofleriaceae bacterium]
MQRAWAAIAVLVAACNGKSDAPASVGGAVGSGAGSGAAGDAAPRSRRDDLAKLSAPLGATVELPADATVESSREPARDADGLRITAPTATVRAGGPALRLSTGVELGWVPTTAEADLAENARREQPFEVASQRGSPDGTWAIAYRRDPERCFVRGRSPPAPLLCATVDLYVPCAETARLLEICTSIAPSATPIAAAPAEPTAAFPKVADAAAALLASRIARAVVHDDRDAVVAAIGPRGLRLKGKQLSREALRKLFAGGESVQKAFDIDCKPPQGSIETPCAWNSDQDAADGSLEVLANEGYGLVPQLIFRKASDGTWALAAVDAVDQGEP